MEKITPETAANVISISLCSAPELLDRINRKLKTLLSEIEAHDEEKPVPNRSVTVLY